MDELYTLEREEALRRAEYEARHAEALRRAHVNMRTAAIHDGQHDGRRDEDGSNGTPDDHNSTKHGEATHRFRRDFLAGRMDAEGLGRLARDRDGGYERAAGRAAAAADGDAEMGGVENENGDAAEEEESDDEGSVDLENESDDEEEEIEGEAAEGGDDAMEVDEKPAAGAAKPQEVMAH